MKVTEKDLYRATWKGQHVEATIPVHRPTDRVVYQFVSPGVVRLGPTVAEFRDLGVEITPLEGV